MYQASKSLMFSNERPWMKRGKLFDVTMGAYDGAKTLNW